MIVFLLICAAVILGTAIYCEAICRSSYELNKMYVEQSKKPDTNEGTRRKFWR